MNRDATALAALTAALVQRLLREGLVLRSLVWPSGLAAGTLLVTLMVAAVFHTSSVVALTPGVSGAIRDQILAEGWEISEVSDLDKGRAEVDGGHVWAATDGAVIALRNGSEEALQLESWLRIHRGSRWALIPDRTRPNADATAELGARIVRILLLLFALYGVVFGLGMVARDRDDGTLEAELSLPIARWVPGAARWLGATAVLTVFLAYSIAIFAALVGVASPGSLLLHGFAAAGGSVSMGIATVGRAGIKQGFSGPLAFGLTGTTGLIALGAGSPEIGQWFPLCSLLAGGSGVSPALLALASGGLASALFAFRSART